MSYSRMSTFLASVLPGIAVSQADPVHAVSSTRHALVARPDRCRALVCRGKPEPLLMRLEPVGVGQTAVSPRLSYDARTRFGRAATVGPHHFIVGVIVIMVVALALRTWNLGGASLWSDEALTALRAHAPLQESLASIMATGNQTPVYFWSLRLLPTSTEALLRLPSALLGLLGIALTIFIVIQLYHDREIALWAGALLAVNPFHVWLSRTARPYSLIFVLALLVSYFFLMLLHGNRSRTMWAGFVISSMVAFATHFTTVALFGAQYVLFAFVLRQNHRLLRRWMVAQGIAAIPVLGWVYFSLREPIAVASEWIPKPTLRDIPLTIWNMALGYDGVFKWVMVPALMIVTLGLVFGMGYAIADRKPNRVNFYWFLLIVVPLFPVFFMSRFVSIYVDRYFTVFLPALILLIVWGWTRHSPQVWRPALIVVIVTSLYTVLFAFHDGSFRRDDWRFAALDVAKGFQPGDAIMLEHGYDRVAFWYYYGTEDENSVPVRAAQPPIVVLKETLDTVPVERSADRLWVIYRNPNDDVHRMGEMPDFDPFDPTLSDMGRWLSKRRDQVIEQRAYNGVRVLLLDPEPTMAAE
jgi:mannosyltransferase